MIRENMRWRKICLILMICIGFLPGLAKGQNIDAATQLGLVPRPKKVMLLAGKNYKITPETVVYYGQGAKSLAQYLTREFKEASGYSLKLKKYTGQQDGIVLELDGQGLKESNQAYAIEVTPYQVVLQANAAPGLFYAIQTLWQLLPPEIYAQNTQSNSIWKIPTVRISDAPLFEDMRGLHVDVSRHFRTLSEMYRIIDYMAMHKLNTLHLHLTDDVGWRMHIKAYPKLTIIGSKGDNSNRDGEIPMFFTQKQLKKMITYANERMIEVFPEIDMPGHMEAAIKAYPELACAKDTRDGAKVIRIDDQGEAFCKTILKEVREVFGPVPIHLGFDEINLGMDSDIYSDTEITAFANTMTDFVLEELGVTPIVWDDAFEKGLEKKEVLVHWWRPEKWHWWSDMEQTIDQKLQKLDQPYIMSPANYTYFDMKNHENSDGQDWAGVVSVDKIYTWEPFRDLVDADPTKTNLSRGIIACTWGEMIKDMSIQEERMFPCLAALAEKAWAQSIDQDPNKPEWSQWRDRVLIAKQIPRYKALGVNYWSKENPKLLSNL